MNPLVPQWVVPLTTVVIFALWRGSGQLGGKAGEA